MTARSRHILWGSIAAALVLAACSNKTPPQQTSAGTPTSGVVAGDGRSTSTPEGPQGADESTGVSTSGGDALDGAPAGTAPPGSQDASSPSPTDPSSPAQAGSTVGLTGDSIRISVSAPFSGLLGQIAEKNFTNGYEVWQKEVNAAGGIHGRKIVFVKVDNANTAEGAVAACKEASSNGTFMVMIELTGGTESDCYESKKVPAFDLGPRFLKPWKYVIGGGHTPLAAPTEVSFLRSRHMNAQAHKIGMIFSADSIGLSSEAKALTAELRNQGMTLVHTEKIATNQASFVSEMSRMKASGAQTVLLLVGLESAGVIRDSKAVGYTPQWYTGPNSSIDLVAQANTGQLQGVFGTRYVTTTETAAFASYVQKVRRHQGESAARSADTLDAQAYAHGDFLGVILRAAGRSLTRESFLAAAGTIEGYDNGLMGTFTLKGRQVPIAIMELVPLRCCNPNSTYRSLGPPSERF